MCCCSREIQGFPGDVTLQRNGMQQVQHGQGQERFVDIHKGPGHLCAVSTCPLR